MSAVFVEVGRIINDFDEFSDEDGKLTDLMSQLPARYEYDYVIFSASGSLDEEEKLWLMDWTKVIKRMMFKKFNGFVEKRYLEKDGD
jgi:hypothetical protein